MEDVTEELGRARDHLESIQRALSDADWEVRKAEKALARAKAERKYVEDVATYQAERVHDLEGLAEGCEHVFEVRGSDRGVGFDTVCTSCGWCQNRIPMV